MNWIHCFWGVGAIISPYIMSYSLTNGKSWNSGYGIVSIVQFVLVAALFTSLPLWKNRIKVTIDKQSYSPVLKLSQIMRIKGVKFILPAFFGYCALEATILLWASSYLVLQRGITPEIAAKYASLFFIGITSGRFLSGLISDKIGDKNMIRIGISIILIGIAMIWLPVKIDWLCLNGLIIIGLGCAPVYPAIIHSTPVNFGIRNS
jgi:fucose permease